MKSFVGQISTSNEINMLTAVNRGGLGGPNTGSGAVAIHTDAKAAGAWETFKLILQPGSPGIGQPGMKFALQTSNGHNYLTAINGGGVGGPDDATSPIHTNAKTASTWENFNLIVDDTANPPTAQIKLTRTPFYLTAVNGGGVKGPNSQPIHSDATVVSTWERFVFQPLPLPPGRLLTYR